jgi:chromatin remodeling complex protein RSC6
VNLNQTTRRETCKPFCEIFHKLQDPPVTRSLLRPEVSQGRFWLISSRVVLYSLPMANESKAKSAFMKPVQPDAALAKIVGANPLPRTELTKKLWEYIKLNKLQDKKLIKADAALETVFNGKKEVDMFELTRLVNTHIIK